MPQKSDADHKSRAELPDVKLQKKRNQNPDAKLRTALS